MSLPPSLELISNPKELESIGKKLLDAEFISFDTEFIRESTFYPNLEILQIDRRLLMLRQARHHRRR